MSISGIRFEKTEDHSLKQIDLDCSRVSLEKVFYSIYTIEIGRPGGGGRTPDPCYRRIGVIMIDGVPSRPLGSG